MARPRKQPKTDPIKLITLMAGCGCTIEEIATTLGISHDTFSRREEFCVAYKTGLTNAKTSLRSKQYQLAMNGDRTMLVWLGKQMLGQRDKLSTELSGPDGGPIQTADLTLLSDAELHALEHILTKAAEAGSGPDGESPAPAA